MSHTGNSLQQAGHPLFTPRVGPNDVAGFFEQVAQKLEIHQFEVLDVFGSGRQVAVETRMEYTYRPTGQRLRDDELHLWTFGADGKIVRFRHYVDTAKHLRAAGLLAS